MIEPLRMSFFVDCPVEHAFHVWTAETGLVSHTSYIGDFDGPYLFADGSSRAR